LTFEQGPIRPPSEAESLLIRVTRNCPHNKCLFCAVYKGKKFSRREPEEVKEDIRAVRRAVEKVKAYASKLGFINRITQEVLEEIYQHEPDLLQIAFWLYRGGRNVFLQDADSLVIPTAQLFEIITFLKEQLPTVERITTYSRSRTIFRKSVADLKQLKAAGLNRIHVGLETGHDPLLQYMQKGLTSRHHIEGGLKVKEAGIELSEYVLLGLGGQDLWREHALDTAKVLTSIDPDFIRIRTLSSRQGFPLQEKIDSGEFKLMDDDAIIREERLMLENLDGTGYLISDHFFNLLEEVEGRLPDALPAMIGVIDRYLSLPEEKRVNFCLGRRLGYYRYLGDMGEEERYAYVERIRNRLRQEKESLQDFLIRCRGDYI
jgi:radical SAM superfamily enzyme YgiQ (UPF0313 family)